MQQQTRAKTVTRASRFGPLGSTLVLLPAIIVLGLRARCEGPARTVEIIALVLYLAWMLVEVSTASLREASLPPAPSDLGTLERYGLAQATTALTAVGLTHGWPWLWVEPAVAIVGTTLVLLGGALRLWSMATLGRWYSRRVRVQEGHQVVAHGPYRLVRHPAYVGNWIGHIGLGLAFQSPWSLATCIGALLPAIASRIRREEAVLIRELPGYAQYAARTRRILPGIW